MVLESSVKTIPLRRFHRIAGAHPAAHTLERVDTICTRCLTYFLPSQIERATYFRSCKQRCLLDRKWIQQVLQGRKMAGLSLRRRQKGYGRLQRPDLLGQVLIIGVVEKHPR